MSGRPWYKRYGADFIAGTLGLTLEEKGAYSVVLDLIYDRGAGIPDDPRYIAGVCGCSVRKWNVIRERLVATGKITVAGGLISNSRAEKEIKNAAKYAEERAESGRKGGEKRAENVAKTNKNNGIAQAELKHTRAFQKPEAREDNNIPSGDKSPSGPQAVKGKTLEAQLFEFGKGVLGKTAGGVIVNLRKACDFDDAYAMDILRQASEKHDPMAWINAAIRNSTPEARAYRGVTNVAQPDGPVIESKADREYREWEKRYYATVL